MYLSIILVVLRKSLVCYVSYHDYWILKKIELGCPRSGQPKTRNPMEKHSFNQEKNDLKHFPNFEKSNFDQKWPKTGIFRIFWRFFGCHNLKIGARRLRLPSNERSDFVRHSCIIQKFWSRSERGQIPNFLIFCFELRNYHVTR